MTFEQVIANRYSARSFKETPLTAEQLDTILNYTQTAPTAKNMQPVKTFVVTNPDMLLKLDELSPCRYGAPAVFAVCYNKNECWCDKYGNSRGQMDASIAATHIMLSATSLGLGTLWVCMFNPEKLKQTLNLSDDIVPCCLIMVGTPTDDCVPSERHTMRKSIDEMFTII